MAFFRCGGSGIPASLKSGMNSVLNKKFGTSTTYDPAGWPADVNLLGPLPVKSVSGAIASFVDGADGVPVKSCVVSFLPSGGGGTPSAPVAITGVSGLSVVKTGINLWDEEVELGSISSSTGADSVSTNSLRTKNYIPVIPQMALYCKNGTLTATNMQVRFYDKNKSYLGYINYMGNAVQWNASSGGSRCIVPENAYYMRFALQSAYGTTYLNDVSINCPITDTDYHAHKTPSVVTDTFGQTIMGGTRDLTTDKASVTWGYIASYNGETLTGRWISSMDTYVAGTTPTTGAEVAYELATPTEITGLTPHEIDTLYGDNNIYADTGTTEVEYRADIDLALNA